MPISWGGALDQPLACYENRNAALWAKGAPYILAWYRKTHAPASDHGLSIVKDNRRDEKPSVSVIIPVYNGEPWLSDCIDSILKQTLRSIEIICIDDGSTDKSQTRLLELLGEDKRFVVAHQENAGQSCARNAALALARGDFVYFIDADDILDTDALSQLYERATQDRLDILFFDATAFADCDDENCLRMAENGKRGYQRHFTYPGVYSGPDLFCCLKENTEFLPSPCLQLVRRAHLADHSLAFADGIVHEDELFTFASILLAGRAGYMARSLYRRRYRMDSTMTRPTSFANVYGYFRCFLGMQDVLGTIRLDERQQEAATNRLGGMLYLARNRYLELSPEEQYAVEGLPAPERKLMKLYVADWGKLKADTQRLTAQLRNSNAQRASLSGQLAQRMAEKAALAQEKATFSRENAALTREKAALARERATLARQLSDIRSGWSFRTGRVITWFPRKVRGGVRCYREHGLAYTLKRILEKCRGK